MADLYLFSDEYDPLRATMAHLQDSTSGWPVSSQSNVSTIYKSSFPQRIRCAQAIAKGQLLNVYFAPDGHLSARQASAKSKELYANSLALGSGNFGDFIYCGVHSAVVESLLAPGNRFLSTVPGTSIDQLVLNTGDEIHQCVGFVANGYFHFEFHQPTLVAPLDNLELGE